MADDGWRSVVNLFVDMTGGRAGWFGRLYQPSLIDQADARARDLETRRMHLEMAQEDNRRARLALETQVKHAWAKGQRVDARQAARDLQRARVEYVRLGAQKNNVAAVASKIAQLRAGTVVEDALEFYVGAMADRLGSANPEQFARLLERCARLKTLTDMNDELAREHFDGEEDLEADDDEMESDSGSIDAVLVELGCHLHSIDAAPSVMALPPPGSGNDDAGGRGGSSAPLSPAI
jgi:hypothetical protein